MVAVNSISPVVPAPLVIATDCVNLPLVVEPTSSRLFGHFLCATKYSARGVFAAPMSEIASDT